MRVAILILLASCSTTPRPGEQACLDAAEAAAKAGARCGFDKGATYANFIREAAGGSCANVTGIRDEDALRKQCFLWLASTSCRNIDGYGQRWDGGSDESCQHQLIRGADAGRD